MKNILKKSGVTLAIAGMVVSCSQQQENANELLQGKVNRETIAIAPKIAGRIAKVFVAEGKSVNQGDTLAVIEVPELDAKLLQAEGAVESASGQLSLAVNGATADQIAQIQGQIDAAEAQVQLAKQSYLRMKNMYEDSLIAAQQFDEIKAKYTAAEAQLKSLAARKLEIVKGTRPETIQSAKGQLNRAIGAKKEVLQANTERFILAPANMLIESITLKQGELATPGYTFISGYETDNTWFRFTVSESKINAWHLNDEVTVKVPFINQTLKGKITAVKQLARYADNTSTAPNYKIGEAVFEVKVVPQKKAEAEKLYTNSTVLLLTH